MQILIQAVLGIHWVWDLRQLVKLPVTSIWVFSDYKQLYLHRLLTNYQLIGFWNKTMSVKGDVDPDYSYLKASFFSCELNLLPKLWEVQCDQE